MSNEMHAHHAKPTLKKRIGFFGCNRREPASLVRLKRKDPMDGHPRVMHLDCPHCDEYHVVHIQWRPFNKKIDARKDTLVV